MRHQVAGRKLGRTSSHRIAMLRNMATSLFRHERIETTVQKAKTLRPFAEKLITLAKKETLHARRQVLRDIHDKEIVSKLFSEIGVRYATRPGGYTRIIKTKFRVGDNAEMAIIELVTDEVAKKPRKRKATAAKKKAAPAAEEKVEKQTAEETEVEEVEEVEAAPAEEAAAEETTEETAEAAPAEEAKVEEPAKAEEAKAEAAPAEEAKEEAAEEPAAEEAPAEDEEKKE